MTTIILTRHGHVDWISPERFRGRAELPLSSLGEQQTEALGQRISKSWKPDIIYTSPLSRCVSTGKAIARLTGVNTQILDDLIDTDYGEWQGLTHEEVSTRWPDESQRWFEFPDLASIPQGETLAEVLVRGIRILQLILHKHRDQTIVLVGHDSINRVLLMHILGLPLSKYWRLKQHPCCINEIVMDDTAFKIHRINDNSHLLDIS